MPPPKMNPEEQKAYDTALRRIEECRRKGKEGTVLNLRGLGLTTLPPEIGQLAALTELRLDHNQLTTLPPEIRRLLALTGLLLHNNQLTTLPPEIGQLTGLTQLWLHNNQLTTLPPEIGQLTTLPRLWLQNNQLTTLPPEIVRLTGLTELFLHGNPGLGLPAEVLGPNRELTVDLLGNTWFMPGSPIRQDFKPASPRAILDYYFARQMQGAAPMQEVRVLLVGRGRVGKTSLLKALRGEKPRDPEPETPGITVLPLELNCTQGKAVGHAWDFGGQEFLHGTHQIFLSERCVYVLVLEGREGNWETETDYWLRFIQSFGSDSPVLVALNKYDAHAFSVDRFRLLERCPQIVGFVETDAFTGRGNEELRGLLERTVNGMEHVWLGVPKKWHRVKEELGKTQESFLEYKDYQALCARLGVEDAQQQDSLAENLHRLGIALNFRDHHRLKHTSVLKPQWVTEGIYGLLRFAQKKDCHGVLERKWIGEALSAKDYPADKHGFVMELMEKFEVAFPLETGDTAAGQPKEPQRWLIPELLPEVQPAAFEEFRAPGVKRLRFLYPEALPPGLLPRLIVRTHEMSEAHAEWRWRSGVVLEWAGARALVRLDRSQRRTTVEVIDCPEPERQGLFDIIRAHLTVLHGKVPFVEEVQALDDPEKWVEMRELRRAEQEEDESIKVTVSDDPNVPRVKVPVVKTLDTVESPEARVAEGPKAPVRMRLFLCYARADTKKLKPLSVLLTILGQRGYIQAWDDKQLVAGEELQERILAELGQADIVLMVRSHAWCASRFVQEMEVPEALRLRKEKGCTVIVLPLDRETWDESVEVDRELKKFLTVTGNAQPVLSIQPPWKAWEQVEESIRKAVEARRKLAR
jgi:signal recognition particle receptor subunit beta